MKTTQKIVGHFGGDIIILLGNIPVKFLLSVHFSC